jgi:hypothetical protein
MCCSHYGHGRCNSKASVFTPSERSDERNDVVRGITHVCCHWDLSAETQSVGEVCRYVPCNRHSPRLCLMSGERVFFSCGQRMIVCGFWCPVAPNLWIPRLAVLKEDGKKGRDGRISCSIHVTPRCKSPAARRYCAERSKLRLLCVCSH